MLRLGLNIVFIYCSLKFTFFSLNNYQNQNINIQNYLPYPSGWLTSIPNYSPQKMYNINIFNGNPKLYQRSIVDINNKKQKFPRFSAKQPKNNINII